MGKEWYLSSTNDKENSAVIQYATDHEAGHSKV